MYIESRAGSITATVEQLASPIPQRGLGSGGVGFPIWGIGPSLSDLHRLGLPPAVRVGC